MVKVMTIKLIISTKYIHEEVLYIKDPYVNPLRISRRDRSLLGPELTISGYSSSGINRLRLGEDLVEGGQASCDVSEIYFGLNLVRPLTVATDKGEDVLETSSVNVTALDTADKAVGEDAEVRDLLGGAED